MVVMTKDRLGNIGHPTRRFDMIRKLVKRGQARLTGGGKSGRPPVVVFLNKVFNPEKTVSRQFLRIVDPGYEKAGFAVVETTDGVIRVLFKGEFETRIPGIRPRIEERKSYRRHRRYIRRLKTKRLSQKQGRNLCKFRKPRNIRNRNKISHTLQYARQVHVNLYGLMHKYCPTPVFQTQNILESNCFDVRVLTWGRTEGVGYQQSPRQVIQDNVCFICSSTENLEKHHLIQRKRNGTDVKENLITLCKFCHESVHKGLIYLPIKGIKQNRALGTVNALTGILKQYRGFKTVLASDIAKVREQITIPKTHYNDAVLAGLVYSDANQIIDNTEPVKIVKTRRHSRARIHALRDRLYKLDGKIVARNRNKKTDQKEDSLREFREKYPEIVGRLKVYPAKKLINQIRKEQITIPGDVWKHNGKWFVSEGVISKRYIYSEQLKEIVGKTYIKPELCERVLRNRGVVICKN